MSQWKHHSWVVCATTSVLLSCCQEQRTVEESVDGCGCGRRRSLVLTEGRETQRITRGQAHGEASTGGTAAARRGALSWGCGITIGVVRRTEAASAAAFSAAAFSAAAFSSAACAAARAAALRFAALDCFPPPVLPPALAGAAAAAAGSAAAAAAAGVAGDAAAAAAGLFGASGDAGFAAPGFGDVFGVAGVPGAAASSSGRESTGVAGMRPGDWKSSSATAAFSGVFSGVCCAAAALPGVLTSSAAAAGAAAGFAGLAAGVAGADGAAGTADTPMSCPSFPLRLAAARSSAATSVAPAASATSMAVVPSSSRKSGSAPFRRSACGYKSHSSATQHEST